MKKFISLLIAICISISIVPQISLTAYASEASGTCGDNLTWELVGDTLTISGEGKMEDFAASDSLTGSRAPWLEYCGSNRKTTIILDGRITRIGAYAFSGMYIDFFAFPEELKYIGEYAFAGSRFYGETRSLNIPQNVSNIGKGAFSCYGIEAYMVEEENEYYTAFSECLFTKDMKTLIRASQGYATLDDDENNLFVLLDYDGVGFIVPEGTEKISQNAFLSCGLGELSIPSTLSEIEDGALVGYQFRDIKVNDNCSAFCSVDGVLFSKDKSVIIRYPALRWEESYSIPEGVKEIAPAAFDSVCEGLYDIYIPETVQTIGQGAFSNCSVTDLAVPYGVTTIEKETFHGCRIKQIYLPKTVEKIELGAFECEYLTDFYYGGSEDDIKSLKVATDGWGSNDAIKNATIHYNSVPDDALEYKSPRWRDGFFNFATEEGKGEAYFEYSDRFFGTDNELGGNGYHYNHNLAQISMRLALSAFAKKTGSGSNKDYSKQYINAENLLDAMGYENIEHNSDYEEKPWNNGIGVIAGHKKINYSGEKYTILAVAIRGGNYEAEWAGNFNVGNDTDHHDGFEIARNSTIQFIQDYVDFNELEGNLKLWITGYSRAGATANLTAAYFDEFPERLPEEVTLTPENIYAYCFEPPAGAIEPDNASGLYNNIFNIVNQHDFVPMVAMKKWGFDRYGITKYLPSPITNGNYGILVNNMQDYFEDYCVEEYTVDNFTYYYNVGEKTEALEKGLYNQGVFLENIMDTLAVTMKNPTYYKNEFQEILSEYVGEEVMGNKKSKELLSSLKREFSSRWPYWISDGALIYSGLGTSIGLLGAHQSIRAALKDSFENVGVEINNEVLNTLGNLMINLGYNSIETFINNGNNIIQGHYPELCMAWLDTIDESDFTTRRLRTFYLNCAVDVEVYDSNGILTAAIINNVPQKIEGSTMVAFVDENGQKIIYLPEDEEYQIKVKATSDGNVTYSIQETDLETGEVKVTNYSNMQLKENDELLGTAENLSEGEANYPLLLNTEAVTPEVIENAECYTVNVEVDGNGFTEGGGIFYKGEYAIVEAAPYNDETFSGWYNGDELVSTENEYRFAVENNTTLTAKFTTNTCEIVFVADDEVISASQIANGATITAPEAPEKSGYNFDGWYLDKEYTTVFDETTPFTNGAVIYAKYTAIPVEPTLTPSRSSGGGGISTYTIKFATNGGNEIESIKVTKNKVIDEPIAPIKDGYSFVGWFTDEELTSAYDFDSKVTKGFTLYAKWEKHDDEKPVEFENPFTDVKTDDWYYEDVLYAVENDLFNGTTETTFAPNTSLTRAMLVTVLYRAEGEPEVTSEIIFDDVDKDSYYEKAVIWAEQNGIANGISKTEFAPDQNITREQIAAIMHRYAQYKGYDVSVGENTNILSYSDYDSISEYAIASMQYAVGSGLMKGKTASTLNPLDNATRAEIAAILHRFLEDNK